MNNQAEDIICKNCNTTFKGNFCPNCSQSVKDYEKPFGLLIYDLMGNMFAFDTRLWRTLKAVMFQPGKIAHEFIIGHRVRYMPPFRFYVFVSFLFFLLLNYATNSNVNNDIKESIEVNFGKDNAADYPKEKSIVIGTDSLKNKAFEEIMSEEVGKELVDDIKRKNAKYEKKIKDVITHPEYYLPQFYKYFSWMLFLVMPLYGSLLWLFFKKSYKYYLGHLIFAINQHSFLFIIIILMITLSKILPDVAEAINGWVILFIPVYSVIGSIKLYKKKWSSVLLRLIVILCIYSILLITGVVLAIIITIV